MSKYRKKIIISLSVFVTLLGAILAANWYITNRLEDKIAAILIRNIEEATGGFYTITYDKLSIGLYDGELSIDNLHFFPDSTVYQDCKQNDSLPKEVVDFRFKRMHFEGVNLKMIQDKQNLQFTLFNIIDPKLKITAPLATRKTKESNPTNIEDPYQLIRNHLKVLSVKELNLKNTQVEYIIEDSVKSSRYAISDTDFSIFNFHLDKDSYKKGKLLFSDNIEFSINKPQVLLANDEFNLSIANLRLSTKDSTITIKGLKLESIENKDIKQSRKLDAELNQIAFHGIALSRSNESRILTAKSFLIDAPRVKMNYQPLPSADEKEEATNIIVQSASLSEIISPIFAKIQIDTISINKAEFDYTIDYKGTDSNYSFSNLNFRAEQFRIDTDSSYISKYEFIHCNEFHLDASQLEASIAELNYKMNVGAFYVDTKERFLSMEKIELQPLDDLNNSVSGKIARIALNGIQLTDNSIRSKSILISRPDVYIKSYKAPKQQQTDTQSPKPTIFAHFNFLKVDKGYLKLEQDSNFFFADDVDLSIHDFVFDENYSIRDFAINMAGIKGKLNSENALFEASNIDYSSIDQDFSASFLNYQSKSLVFSTTQLKIDQLAFHQIEKDSLSAKKITLTSPSIENKDFSFNSPEIRASDFSWIPNQVLIDSLSTLAPRFAYVSRELELRTTLENLSIEGIAYINDELILSKNILKHPDIFLSVQQGEKSGKEPAEVNLEKIKIGEIFIDEANLRTENIAPIIENIQKIDIYSKNITFSPNKQLLSYELVTCKIPDISISLDNGFYTLSSEKIFADIYQSEIDIEISKINLKSKYPKFEFAYHHPKNKDWFGLSVGSVKLKGIDISELKQDRIYATNLYVNDTYLYNLKNQNIKIQHNLMPMIYEAIHNFPKKFRVKNTEINNFNVSYEEIARGTETPGRIFFTDMNGKLSNFTNIEDNRNQYLDVYATGLLMGTGYFNALWQIPVSPQNDNFNLKANLVDFQLTELNQLLSPMAPVSINSGYSPRVDFDISASTIDAHIDMTFLYDKLDISLWSVKKGKVKNKWLYSKAVNLILKNENLDSKKKLSRKANLEVVRNPYHSTFNYFWQILQPAIAESVGVSEKKQNRLKKFGKVYNSIQNFFRPNKKKESEKD